MKQYSAYYLPAYDEARTPYSAKVIGRYPETKKLRTHVISFWSYQLDAAPPTDISQDYLHRMSLPNVLSGLVFVEGSDITMTPVSGRATVLKPGHLYLLGPQQNTVLSNYPGGGRVKLIGVEMPANQLFYLLNLPLYELTDRVIDFREFDPCGADYLCELFHAFPWSTDKIEQFLMHCFADAETADPVLSAAIDSIIHRKGIVRMKDLSGYLNIDPRTLTRKFQFYQGILPKKFSRIIRFRHTYNQLVHTLISRKATGDLFDVLLAGDYYDQSHLIKDFHHFLGTTPNDFVRKFQVA